MERFDEPFYQSEVIGRNSFLSDIFSTITSMFILHETTEITSSAFPY